MALPIGVVAALVPEVLYGLSAAAVATAVAGVIFWRREAAHGRTFAYLVLAALMFRYCMALANLAVGLWFYGGAVDFTEYNNTANLVGAKVLAGDFSGGNVWGGLTGWVFSYVLGLLYLYAGSAYLGKFFVSALVGFTGSYLFFEAFRAEFPAARSNHRFIGLALFFFPSFAYWTSLLGKESWMALFLGLTTYALSKLVRHASAWNFVLLLVSLAGTTLVRPAVGAIVVAASGVGLLIGGPRRGPAAILRPVVVTGAVVIVALVFSKMGSFALAEKFQEDLQQAERGLVYALHYQHAGLATDPTAAGSSLEVQIAEPSPGALLQYLPLGIFTFLFRPLIFEAHNVLALIAAIESTFFAILVLGRARPLLRGLRGALSRPFLAFSALNFVLLTVALSFESNFGAIVRHRSMVLPFLLMLLAVPPAAASRPDASARPALRGGATSARA